MTLPSTIQQSVKHVYSTNVPAFFWTNLCICGPRGQALALLIAGTAFHGGMCQVRFT